MEYYVTIECPRCKSTSQIKVTTISNGPLLCPVCSDGEIELNISPRSIIRDESKFFFTWKNPLTDYNAAY